MTSRLTWRTHSGVRVETLLDASVASAAGAVLPAVALAVKPAEPRAGAACLDARRNLVTARSGRAVTGLGRIHPSYVFR